MSSTQDVLNEIAIFNERKSRLYGAVLSWLQSACKEVPTKEMELYLYSTEGALDILQMYKGFTAAGRYEHISKRDLRSDGLTSLTEVIVKRALEVCKCREKLAGIYGGKLLPLFTPEIWKWLMSRRQSNWKSNFSEAKQFLRKTGECTLNELKAHLKQQNTKRSQDEPYFSYSYRNNELFRNACQTLGIPETATHAEGKLAYRKLCGTAHPDKGGTHDAFIAVNGAWDVFCNRRPAK